MADYADWTESIELLGTEIQVPIDLQGAFIQLPMDIQGAFIQLPVDIQGQFVDLDINIVAQEVDVTINITAQTVAIKSQGEWSPQVGQQKYVTGLGSNLVSGDAAYADYSVTAGKTLYITHFGFSIGAAAAANGDLPQIGRCSLYNFSTGVTLSWIGGNGGGGLSFPTPLKVTANQIIHIIVTNQANHTCHVAFSWGGYEI